jgi:hypothetical protein
VGIISAQDNLTCQYQENQDTGKTERFFYDSYENIIPNPIQFTFSGGDAYNIGGPCNCHFSFTIKNNAEEKVSLKLYYISVIGNNRHDNSEDIKLDAYESKTISGDLGDMCWASCGVDSNSVSYQFNSDSEIKSKIENIFVDVCKQCNEKDCLNDGENCSSNFECGSGICNIAGFCGIQKVADCPEGFKNCNNQSCLSIETKNIGEKYSCEFECKTKYGKEGICKVTIKEKISKFIFITIFVLIIIQIIYFIITGEKLFNFKRRLKR